MEKLRDLCRTRLQALPGVVLLGRADAPHILNLSVPGLRSQGLINCLQEEQVYVSDGSACSKGHRSQGLEAMKLPPAVIDGSIRVSLSMDTTEDHIFQLEAALKKAILTLKG